MNKDIQQATSTGRPLGSIAFVENLEKMFSRKLLAGKVGRPTKK